MYRIGLFSKMNRITAKTLRHYDDIGLLKPEYVDDFTGYRYYSGSQIPRLHKIIALKQMGLNLTDIKTVIDEPVSIELFLKLKENELKKKIQEANNQLIQIDNYMKRIQGGISMKYNPVIKSLPEVIVASMRFTAKSYDDYFEVVPKMGEEMSKAGVVCAEPEYCFNIYHDKEYKEKDIDVEVCEAVIDFYEDTDKVKYKRISKVNEAVCVLHKGPYDLLREAYTFTFEWIKNNGYQIIGEPRESYIDGIWNEENEEKWLTEIQIPIKTNSDE